MYLCGVNVLNGADYVFTLVCLSVCVWAAAWRHSITDVITSPTDCVLSVTSPAVNEKQTLISSWLLSIAVERRWPATTKINSCEIRQIRGSTATDYTAYSVARCADVNSRIPCISTRRCTADGAPGQLLFCRPSATVRLQTTFLRRKVIPEQQGGANFRCLSPEPDTSSHCESKDTGLVHRAVCPFTSQLLLVLISPTHGGMARLSWPGWLDTYRDGLSNCRRSPIKVLTGPGVD